MTVGVTIIGKDRGENYTFQMDNKSTTKLEMKVRKHEVYLGVELHPLSKMLPVDT